MPADEGCKAKLTRKIIKRGAPQNNTTTYPGLLKNECVSPLIGLSFILFFFQIIFLLQFC